MNEKKPVEKHTISVLVENKFGVLARISNLFSARGFNIDSLAVGETEDATVSRMTIVLKGDKRILEQVKKQLNKLIDIVKVFDFTRKPFVARQLMLIKVAAVQKTRPEILRIIESVSARIIDAGSGTITVEMVGDDEQVNALIELLRPYGIREIVRTGRVALAKESQ